MTKYKIVTNQDITTLHLNWNT